MQFVTVENLILIVVTFLVTAGIKSLSATLGRDLSGVGAALTAGLVGLVVTLFNTLVVPAIPASALSVVEPAAGLLIVILGAFGVHAEVKKFRV